MKILEINKFFYSRRGGDKHFMDVIKLLKSKGHEVAVFSMTHLKNEKSQWEKYFLSYVGYNKNDSTFWQKIKGGIRMFYSLEAKSKINKLLDDFKPDIVHIHNVYHQLSPIILFEIKKRNIPIIMTVHDYKIINPNHGLYINSSPYNRCKNGKYYECLLDKCVKNSYLKSFIAMLEMYWHEWLGTYRKNINLYLAPSLFAKNILSDWGIDSRKIRILPHFISPGSNTVFQYAGVNNENLESVPYVLYAGAISREKGVDKLIDIFKNIGGIKLYLAGNPENNFKITQGGNIKLLGHLNQDDLRGYIKNAKFIASASKLPETFGLIALEANACGKPFIGFKAGAYPEIIENNVNGALVDTEEEMKNAILKIKKGEISFNEEKIRQLTYQKFGRENYYQKILTIFQEQPLLDKNKLSC